MAIRSDNPYPIQLKKEPGTNRTGFLLINKLRELIYSMMVLTMPEPTVWPPSRIAKRRPSSMAIG